MKTVTSAYLGEARKLAGAVPIRLVKIFYGTSSSMLISDRPVTIGSDVYNPWLKTIGNISYALSSLPGLGRLADCELEIVRNTTTDNLLTQTLQGKKVQIWQWFEGLADADKLPLANLIVQEPVDATQSTFTLRCISPETKLKQRIPSKDLNKTDFPNMPDSNVGIPRPIVFGDFMYKKKDGTLYWGSTVPLTNRIEEYIQCKKPNRVPVPAFWIDFNVTSAASQKKKLIAHESADALEILTDTTQLLGQEMMRYFSQLELYGYCRNENASAGFPGKVWTVVNTSGQTRIDRNLYDTGATTLGGQFITLYIPANGTNYSNGTTNPNNAVDFDPATVASLPETGNLWVYFPDKGKPQGYGIKRYIAFNITMAGAGGSLKVYDGFDSVYTLRETISGPITGATYHQTEVTWWTDASDDFFKTNNYSVRFECVTGSATIDGVAIKLIFRDEEDDTRRAKMIQVTLPGNIPGAFGKGTVLKEANYTNVFFFNTRGVNVSIDGKTYDYRHPVYVIQYILRQILSYASTELGYVSIGASYVYLANNAPFSNDWLRFGRAINEFSTGEEIADDLVKQMGCWMWWGAEGFWQVIPCNYSNFLTSSIRIFSDKTADSSLSPATLHPMSNFKWKKTDKIYNRFEFNIDFEYATGQYRNRVVYDQVNKTELATSVSTYGYESLYPTQNYSWYRDTLQVDNFYAVVKALKDPRIEIEFDTTLCASHLEVGDNIKVDHTAQTWAAPTPTTGKEFQILEHEQTGNVIHIKAVEIVP